MRCCDVLHTSLVIIWQVRVVNINYEGPLQSLETLINSRLVRFSTTSPLDHRLVKTMSGITVTALSLHCKVTCEREGAGACVRGGGAAGGGGACACCGRAPAAPPPAPPVRRAPPTSTGTCRWTRRSCACAGSRPPEQYIHFFLFSQFQ